LGSAGACSAVGDAVAAAAVSDGVATAPCRGLGFFPRQDAFPLPAPRLGAGRLAFAGLCGRRADGAADAALRAGLDVDAESLVFAADPALLAPTRGLAPERDEVPVPPDARRDGVEAVTAFSLLWLLRVAAGASAFLVVVSVKLLRVVFSRAIADPLSSDCAIPEIEQPCRSFNECELSCFGCSRTSPGLDAGRWGGPWRELGKCKEENAWDLAREAHLAMDIPFFCILLWAP
jgi:hypothetical protein